MPWYKGNLHCHSNKSDGRAVPEHVAKFYKFKGDDLYVRVRIASTAGVWAWMQPVFLDDLKAAIRWTNSTPKR